MRGGQDGVRRGRRQRRLRPLHRPDLPVRDGQRLHRTTTKRPPSRHSQALGEQATHECVGKEVADAIAEQLGIEIGDIEAEPLSIGDYAATRLTISATAFGIEVDAPFDIVVARSGRGITYWVFGSSQTPFDETLRDQLLGTAVDRLTENLGRIAKAPPGGGAFDRSGP